jgi:Leucine-rich repeat (LRR) protein
LILDNNSFSTPRLFGPREYLNTIGTLTKLKELSIHRHFLSIIPSQLSNLTNLEKINLSQGSLLG